MTEKAPPTYTRPTSPHLQIYHWQLTMLVSILHRVTGVALFVGTFVLIAWIWAAAYDANSFTIIHNFLAGIYGRILLIGWSLAFYFHLANGIRHLFWDVGMGFEKHQADASAWAVVISSVALTAGTWTIILHGAQ